MATEVRLWSNDIPEDTGKMKLDQALDGWGHAGLNVSPHFAGRRKWPVKLPSIICFPAKYTLEDPQNRFNATY